MLNTASLIGLALYFVILLLVVLKEKKNSDVEDYFFAGRSLPFWALSITFIASWWGGGSALSTADLAFADGMGAFWYYGVPVLVATLLMGLGARAIRSVGYLTQGAMMEARYSRPVARLLALMILFFMLFSAASQMVAVGDFFGTFLGMGYEGGVLAGTLIVLVYSMFGGFRGVVLTDIIQFVLLLLSALAVFVVAMQECGGLGPIAEAAARSGRPEFMSLTAGALKYLMYVITFGCSWMIQANVWQRISATRDTRDARRMTVMSFFVYIPLYLIVVLTGMAGNVLFDTLPKGGVVPALVESSMSPLLAAVVFVGISAAIMSTMDSLINTGAMTLVMDLLPGSYDEKTRLRLSRLTTLVIVAVGILISLRIRSIFEITWIASDIITTGVFVPLVLAFFWRRGTSRGALCSMLCGLAYCLYNLAIFLGMPLPAFWEQQSALQVILGVCLSLLVFTVTSLLDEPEYHKADAFLARTRQQACGQHAAPCRDARAGTQSAAGPPRHVRQPAGSGTWKQTGRMPCKAASFGGRCPAEKNADIGRTAMPRPDALLMPDAADWLRQTCGAPLARPRFAGTISDRPFFVCYSGYFYLTRSRAGGHYEDRIVRPFRRQPPQQAPFLPGRSGRHGPALCHAGPALRQ